MQPIEKTVEQPNAEEPKIEETKMEKAETKIDEVKKPEEEVGKEAEVTEGVTVSVDEEKKDEEVEKKTPSPKRRKLSDDLKDNMEPPSKSQKVDVEDYMPLEVLQTLQQLSVPKLGNNGLPCRPKAMTIVDGRPTLPDMDPLQQCQHLQQIQSLIHYHEQQVKYRSYIQLEILRHLRKQLNDQMLLHPQKHNYEALVAAAKNNRLTPLSMAERAQLEYFNQMADWTLDARATLQNKESPTYLQLFGRQVNEFKSRMNEITTHEQFDAFGALFAERIDYHRELIHTLNRRSSVTLA
uniref:Uncharacterized protein n=1 Tax=Caenorhabditis tropicalis TaxID=1561998 RepID=A0A1I7TZY5_9PELO